MTNPIRPAQLLDRVRLIMGLRALATFLEENPGVPVPRASRQLEVFTEADDCDTCQRAEIDRIAALLDVTPEDEIDDGGHYTAAKWFGPLAYKAVFIPERNRRASRALMSYADNFSRSASDTTATDPGQAA